MSPVSDQRRPARHGQRTGELDPNTDPGLAGAATIGALPALLAEALSRKPPPPQDRVFDAARGSGQPDSTRKDSRRSPRTASRA
jgi:hypothetical protein